MNGMSGEEPTNPPPPHDNGWQHRSHIPAHHNANGSTASAQARNGDDPSADPDDLRSFSVEQRQGCAVVVAFGEIDLTTAPALRQALEVASQVEPRVVLDLNLVTFIDSSGLAVLLEAYKHRRLGHQIALCLGSTGTIVRRVLKITHMNTMLPTYDTLAEAIEGPA